MATTSPRPAIPDQKKRLLALSGGGVRGIIEVAFLEHVERVLKQRYGPDTRLCDAFDLIGGTSTGALIATSLALGTPLERIRSVYLDRAVAFFGRRKWWAFGRAPMFDGQALEREILSDVGDLTLGSDALQTHLALVVKRLDTGSPWVLSNIASAPYFDDPGDGTYRGNRHYPLSQILRAATAAPTLFAPQHIAIGPGQTGVFIDGGVSPHNDPSLMLLQLARLRSFGLNWPADEDHLFVLSIGSGRYRQTVRPDVAMRLGPLRVAYLAIMGMMQDVEHHNVAMMEWLGRSKWPARINSELGTLEADSLMGAPAFGYLRLNLPLDADALAEVGLAVAAQDLKVMRRLDDPAAIPLLYDLTHAYCAATFDDADLLEALG